MTKPPIVVVSTTRNAEQYAARCVRSVRNQSVPCQHFYVDDDSEDGTYQEALAAVERKARHPDTTTTVIRTFTGNQGQNLISIIGALSPDTIVVWLDGDDWLWSSDSLEPVLEAHLDGAWVTYGNFMHADGRYGWARGFEYVSEEQGYKRDDWNRGTHLRTFRAGLFQLINEDELRQAYTIDVSIMWPVLEMAGERFRFIDTPLCCYEAGNPVSAHNQDATRAREIADFQRIQAMTPYKRLERAPW